MADKSIGDLTATSSLAVGDLFEIENAGGNSRKITWADLKAALGLTHYVINRIFGIAPNAAATTVSLNSTSYAYLGSSNMHIDLDEFPATHYRIAMRGLSNEAAQTITLQLVNGSTPSSPVQTGGNDLVIPNTDTQYNTAWLSRDDGLTGLQIYGLAAKGSNATVDLSLRIIDIHWAINP